MKEDLKDYCLDGENFTKLVELRTRAYKSQELGNTDAPDNHLFAKSYNELADFFGFPKLSEKAKKASI